MNSREKGFLLLCSHLGNPKRRPLTTAQLRTLSLRMQEAQCTEPDRQLCREDLTGLGLREEMAQRILQLLEDEELLELYLQEGRAAGCVPVSRVSKVYPPQIANRLGQETPGCLWMKGDKSLLLKPAVSLVGSRDLLEANREFAREVGRQAALQGYVLVSGNARGADRTAQDSCLEAGGQVISIVADSLVYQQPSSQILYISEDGYDLPFSPARALSRNRLIHCMGNLTFVAQCTLGQGGTWDGTVRNLKGGWSPVFCFQDGSGAATELEQMGAEGITVCDLANFLRLKTEITGLFD